MSLKRIADHPVTAQVEQPSWAASEWRDLTRVGTGTAAGQQWRANFYRIDYDAAPASHWAWEPRTGANFHDCRSFGTVTFE